MEGQERPQRLVKSVGNPVDGDRFFNRDVERAELRELLDEGANVLLVAPRRVGKTSLMRETARCLGDDWICLSIDVEAEARPEGLVVKLAAAAWEHQNAKGKVRSMFDALSKGVDTIGVEELSVKLRDELFGSWRDQGRRLVEELASLDRPVVIFLDELPILVHRLLSQDDRRAGLAQADALMSWIREVSLAHVGRVRWVLAGSIGLGPILEDAGLSATANHLTAMELGPWSPHTAQACLRALAESYGLEWQTGAAEQVTALLGACVPHHVQVLFARLLTDARRRGAPLRISVADVVRVYEREVGSTALYRDLIHYEERLAKVVGPDATPLALDLLTEAAVEGGLSHASALDRAHHLGVDGPEAVVRRVLRILQHDGYLAPSGESLSFISLLLRDFWRSRIGVGWRPTPRGDA